VRLSELDRREREKQVATRDDELFVLVRLSPEQGEELQALAARFDVTPERVLHVGLRALVAATERAASPTPKEAKR
jgi:hypothetical protein